MLNKTALFASLLLACLCGSSFAKTVTDAKLGMQVDLPDDWKLEEGDRTTASTPEGFSLVVMHVEGKLAFEIVKDLDKVFTGLFTESKITDTDKVAVNNFAGEKVTGYAMRDGNRVRFTALLIGKDNKDTLIVLAIGPETEFKRHLRESDAAFDSVKAKP